MNNTKNKKNMNNKKEKGNKKIQRTRAKERTGKQNRPTKNRYKGEQECTTFQKNLSDSEAEKI